MTGRTGLPELLLGLAIVVLSACSASPATFDGGGSDVVRKTTAAASTTTTLVPDAPTTTEPPASVLPPPTDPEPQLADPYDLAEAALVDLEGFTVVEEAPLLLDILDFRIGNLYDTVIRALVWDHVATGGDGVLVAAIYPHAEFRGDPFLALGIAEVLADPDGELGEVVVAGHDIQRVFVDDVWWYVWANNTHALVAAGPEAAAEEAIAQLIAGNGDEYLWGPGDCLYLSPADGAFLPYAPYGRGMVVPCEGPHHFEVVYSGLVREPDAAFQVEQLTRDVLTACDEGYESHTGLAQLDGVLDIIWFQPDLAEWGQGDRYGACVVFRTERSVPVVTTEPYAGAGDRVRIERQEGDCHRWTVLEPRLDCDGPHDFEYLGAVELADAPGAEWPGPDDQDRLEKVCRPLLEAKASRVSVEQATLDVFTRSVGPHRWNLGHRTVQCFAFAADDVGTGLSIAGKISGDWEPVGESGGGVTT